MKNLFKYLSLSLLSLFLVACQPNHKESQDTKQKETYVRLIVKEDTNTIDEKVPFKKGDTAMDVLKDNYKVEEKDGFITAIDNHKQDSQKKRFWFFKINDKLAPKAADQITLKESDKLEFYQEVVK
ncbi:DUF4430 domain-containing protein [Streptococcus didelphis]|uniref:DUF4430 domain-containing protein n=1 Tax=Streptococcus didelphis TaxID=102886 RepID=A0ABY9LHX2_9STRE|nr:DUF4430 domain-containing protein [Streptococcus didelphis]WMB28431.1 DUF4430 domain-containing protein [Streptococcus didelphis]WMB29108.1 DUF4430 domain-containing protein [Streptococcus didelphis]